MSDLQKLLLLFKIYKRAFYPTNLQEDGLISKPPFGAGSKWEFKAFIEDFFDDAGTIFHAHCVFVPYNAPIATFFLDSSVMETEQEDPRNNTDVNTNGNTNGEPNTVV